MGGAALRARALHDPAVIDRIDRDFVPVWINVRREPVPEFPAREQVLLGAPIGSRDQLTDPFSQGFFLRLVVLDPEDLSLLNPQAPTVGASVRTFTRRGHFAYAQASPKQVHRMLDAVGGE